MKSNEIDVRVALGRDSLAFGLLGESWWVIRITFTFPPRIKTISTFMASDDRINRYFIYADKCSLSGFIGKSPLEVARLLDRLYRANERPNYYLSLLLQFLEKAAGDEG